MAIPTDDHLDQEDLAFDMMAFSDQTPAVLVSNPSDPVRLFKTSLASLAGTLRSLRKMRRAFSTLKGTASLIVLA
jgi:hypothetical protein